MADIFISYAREDREAVEKLSGLLEASGFSCWWDKQLAAGAKYREKTEIELNAAKAVLVVWTKHSFGSHWVADEATAAVEAGKLVPISLDGASPPLGFRQFQVIDFKGWKGGADEPMPELIAALATFNPQTEIKQTDIKKRATTSSLLPAAIPRAPWLLVLPALAIIATAGLFLLLLQPPASTSSSSQRVAFFGFTPTDANPLSAKIAADATDQAFAEFTRFHLDATAKADSLAPSATDRLTRATALGATYALSGEVRVEGEEARFAIRLEDTVTRATLWEAAEASPVARQFYSPSSQAAFRAATNTDCVIRLRAELSHENPEAQQAINGYCVRPFSAGDAERTLLAFRTLAKLEPSAFFKTSLASNLVFSASYLPADLRAERLAEVDVLLTESLRMRPGYSYATATAEFLLTARGGSPVEAEQLLATAQPGGSAWGEGFLLYRRGLNLLGNGRTAEGVARLRAAEAATPSFTQVSAFRAYGLASQGKAADAELLFEQVFASEPGATLVWPTWARAAVLDGVGAPEAMLAAAPQNESLATVACWRSVMVAKRTGKSGPSRETLTDCGPIMPILVALGRVDEAFDYYRDSQGQGLDTRMLFTPSARAMRAHADFLPLMKKLRLWDYWIDTGTHPDVCDLPEERSYQVCEQLRAVQSN